MKNRTAVTLGALLAAVLGGMVVAPSGHADGFNPMGMMNPSKWMGGGKNNRDDYYGGPGYGAPGYGYGAPGYGYGAPGYGYGAPGYGYGAPGYGYGAPGYGYGAPGYGYGAPGYGYGAPQQGQGQPAPAIQ